MALIAAKCTNCGSNIKVENSIDAGICEYCGVAFITEKVINNNITNVTNVTHLNNATINIQSKNVAALKKLAQEAYDREDYHESYKYFTQICELDENDYESKFKRSLASAMLFSLKDSSRVSVPLTTIEPYCKQISKDTSLDFFDKSMQINLAFVNIMNIIKSFHSVARQHYIKNNKTNRTGFYAYLAIVEDCIEMCIKLLNIEQTYKDYVIKENIIFQTNTAFEFLNFALQKYADPVYFKVKYVVTKSDRKTIKYYINLITKFRKQVEPKFKVSKLKLKNL